MPFVKNCPHTSQLFADASCDVVEVTGCIIGDGVILEGDVVIVGDGDNVASGNGVVDVGIA